MTKAVAEQITRRFRAIQDVKFAITRLESTLTARQREPDIAVETWMNSRLFIYILTRAPKSRTIRALLKQNTSASIGTLFIVDAALLPADGARGKLQPWQDDLRAMNLGAIYAYSMAEGEARLLQINLDETPTRGLFAAWHTLDFPCDALSVRRRELHAGLRGVFCVGDIASPQFRRRISDERARLRFHYRTQGAPGGEAPEGVSAAYLALELEVGAGQEAVKQAFRKLAREYHPDVSALDKAMAERRFKEVRSAYDKIKSHRRWR